MSLELEGAQIEAVDISESALRIAEQNNEWLKAEVVFHQLDILSSADLPNKYDIIVSNPPYVMNQEKAHMEHNVLD